MLSPLGRNFYLNITPNNLVRLYLHADAVPPGSAASVRIRELSSADWDNTRSSGATEPSCSSGGAGPDTELPATSCIGGRIVASCVLSSTANVVTNPRHYEQQSLSELVSALRNCSSVRTQAPGQLGLCSAPGNNTSWPSSVPRSFCGNLSEADPSHRVQTVPLKLHDQSKISASLQRFSSPCIAPREAVNAPRPASQRSSTPSQVKSIVISDNIYTYVWLNGLVVGALGIRAQ